MTFTRFLLVLGTLTLVCRVGSAFAAETAAVYQLPSGATATVLDGTICGTLPDGWSFDARQRQLRVSSSVPAGSAIEVRTAENPSACMASRSTATWIATGPWPVVDPASVVLWPDEGRIEFKGHGLAGVQVAWRSEDENGVDACHTPETIATVERCVLVVGRGVATTVALTWLPAGARTDNPGLLHDNHGRATLPQERVLHPARTVLSRVLPATTAVDLADGLGRIPLPHPEAVASVDCGLARCEISDDDVVVRSVPGQASAVTVKVRLAPHVLLQRGEAFETSASAVFSLIHCAVAMVSGAPFRDLDDTRVVVRMDARCAKTPRALRWTADGDPADVLRVEKEKDITYVLLRIGRIDDDIVTIQANRPEPDAPVLVLLTEKTRPPPLPRPALELPGLGSIDFIPRNRDALLHLPPIDEHTRLIALPIPGAVQVRAAKSGFALRGEETGGGSVALRYGVRVATVPAALQDVNLAIVTDAVQRPLRDAHVPVPLTGTQDRQAIVEFFCDDATGHAVAIEPGKTPHIPFEFRESCRVVVHAARLQPDEGTQEILVEADVLGLDGAVRAAAHVGQRMLLRPGAADRVLWIRGAKAPFDRISVRVQQQVDEFLLAPDKAGKSQASAAQWSVILGTGRFRFYATASFPTGLYRVNQPTGLLSLNFGVLSRLALLDNEGKEGLLGLELGAIGVGLVGNGNFPNYPPTLATVAGVGVSIPLGGAGQTTQASLNLHGWFVYEFRNEFNYYANAVDAAALRGGRPAPHVAFVFGPSLSIGNIGTIL